MNHIELNNHLIEVIEERRGSTIDDDGFVNKTYNTYAGIGYETDENGNHTGKIIAWAGDNPEQTIDIVENESLDDYLTDWDSEWQELFKEEGII